MLRFLGWLLVFVLVVAGIWGYFFLEAAGVFLTIPARQMGMCTPVTGVVGVEDIAIDRVGQIAFLSGYDRRAVFAGKKVRGAIWTYALSQAGAVPVDATASMLPEGFNPHGISLYRAADGKKTLFVINHAGDQHTIEIFDVSGARLVHRRTVSGEEFVSPNDVAGTGPDSFYIANDHGIASGWMQMVEDLGRLRLSTVQYYNGHDFETVISALGSAIGINISDDGRTLYVSAGAERMVYVYDRDLQTNRLSQRARVAVPGYPDNLDVQANGDLLLAVHSKLLDFLAHVGDAKKLSPSHVMLMTPDSKGSLAAKTIYYNSGSEISAASVAAGFGKRLLIGSVFEAKILDCGWNGAP